MSFHLHFDNDKDHFKVDLEINGEPVDIWMKLDDSGAAFFVEDVEDTEDTVRSPDSVSDIQFDFSSIDIQSAGNNPYTR